MKKFIEFIKPRNPVVKNQKTSGAGYHPDKKRADKQGDVKHKKSFKDMHEEIYEACWDTHKQIGMKKKGNRMVPNCVPRNEEKDEREYGYEGDMAISQLKTLVRHSEMLLSMLKPETDLPEWVQSKITLATDYIQTSHDYLMSEEEK